MVVDGATVDEGDVASPAAGTTVFPLPQDSTRSQVVDMGSAVNVPAGPAPPGARVRMPRSWPLSFMRGAPTWRSSTGTLCWTPAGETDEMAPASAPPPPPPMTNTLSPALGAGFWSAQLSDGAVRPTTSRARSRSSCQVHRVAFTSEPPLRTTTSGPGTRVAASTIDSDVSR